MKRFFLLMLIVLTMSGCAGADVDIKKELTIGIDEGFAPMGFRDEHGDIVGFDVDMAKEAALRLNVEIKFKPIKREIIARGGGDKLIANRQFFCHIY